MPFFIVFKHIAVDDGDRHAALYAGLLDLAHGFAGYFAKLQELSFDNYIWLTEDPLYINAYLSSVVIAGISTVLTLLDRLSDRLWHGAGAAHASARRC